MQLLREIQEINLNNSELRTQGATRYLGFLNSHWFLRLSVLASFLLASHEYAIATSDATKGPPLCVFKALTGYPCPFCGLTRAYFSLTDFHADQAFRFNVLIYPMLFIALPLYLYPKQRAEIAKKLASWWWARKISAQILTLMYLAFFFAAFDIARINYFPIP